MAVAGKWFSDGDKWGGMEIASKISRKLFLSGFPHHQNGKQFPRSCCARCIVSRQAMLNLQTAMGCPRKERFTEFFRLTRWVSEATAATIWPFVLFVSFVDLNPGSRLNPEIGTDER